MKKGIIITLPRYDDVTEYLSQFSQEIEKEAEKRGINFKKLRDKQVTKKEFKKIITKIDYNMIIFNGHGSDSSIGGHDGEEIIKLGENEYLLKERIVYARSCHAAVKLGIECTKDFENGCFIGYDRPFQFWFDKSRAGNPLKDNIAKLFLKSSNLIPISIIKGNSTKESNEKSKTQMIKNIKKVLIKPSPESFTIAEALWNNYDGQTLQGNPEVRL